MTLELVPTEDGSLSIRDAATGELHHNRAGAYEEALVNYVQPSGVLFAPDMAATMANCVFSMSVSVWVITHSSFWPHWHK
jgi:hypothetical protein